MDADKLRKDLIADLHFAFDALKTNEMSELEMAEWAFFYGLSKSAEVVENAKIDASIFGMHVPETFITINNQVAQQLRTLAEEVRLK